MIYQPNSNVQSRERKLAAIRALLLAQSGLARCRPTCPLLGRSGHGGPPLTYRPLADGPKADIEGSKIPQCSSTRRAIPFIREARELMGSKTTRVHHAARWSRALSRRETGKTRH